MGRTPTNFGKLGYSQEEAYFHNLNQQLIESRRRSAKAPLAVIPLDEHRARIEATLPAKVKKAG